MQTVDLSSHINETVEKGHPADFPVILRPLYAGQDNGSFQMVPRRVVVVRADSGQPISVVSDRYSLVPHQRILDTIRNAIEPLDVGPCDGYYSKKLEVVLHELLHAMNPKTSHPEIWATCRTIMELLFTRLHMGEK